MNGQPNDPYQYTVPPQNRRSPHNDLDLNLMLTDPVVGSENVDQYLQEPLEKTFYMTDKDGKLLVDEHGNPVVNKDSMWKKLNFFTRDMRLANLSTEELNYCNWYVKMAGYCIQEGYLESFVIALQDAMTVLELSQSKKGFLRKQPNTLRTESVTGDLEPQKKSLFSGKKQ